MKDCFVCKPLTKLTKRPTNEEAHQSLKMRSENPSSIGLLLPYYYRDSNILSRVVRCHPP